MLVDWRVPDSVVTLHVGYWRGILISCLVQQHQLLLIGLNALRVGAQVVNATKGLTFSDTPEFAADLLAPSSGQPEQYRADSQSTTYDAAHVGE